MWKIWWNSWISMSERSQRRRELHLLKQVVISAEEQCVMRHWWNRKWAALRRCKRNSFHCSARLWWRRRIREDRQAEAYGRRSFTGIFFGQRIFIKHAELRNESERLCLLLAQTVQWEFQEQTTESTVKKRKNIRFPLERFWTSSFLGRNSKPPSSRSDLFELIASPKSWSALK